MIALDVPGVQVALAPGEPGGGVGHDEGQVAGQVVQVLAGVIQVDDLGGLGERSPSSAQIHFAAVADERRWCITPCLAAGLRPRPGRRIPSAGPEAGQVAGRGRVGDGPAPSSSYLAWVNRQASFTSRVWARPSSALPGPPWLVSAPRHRHPGPVDLDIQRARGRPWTAGNGITRRARIAADSASPAARTVAPLSFSGPFHPLDGQARSPASSASRAAARANGTAVAAWAAIERSPGDKDARTVPSSRVAGHDTVPGTGRSDSRRGARRTGPSTVSMTLSR